MRLLLPLLLSGVLALTGCTSLEGTGDKGYITGDGQVVLLDEADRGEPVTLTGDDLDGEQLDIEDFRGKPVVAVVWGSWCPPCRAEAPDLVEAAEELGDTAQFVGLNIRDGSEAQGQAFERSYDVPYPSFFSPDGRVLLAFAGALTPNSIPSTVVLDEEGRVAATIIGRIPSTTTLVDVVEDVVKGSAPRGAGEPSGGGSNG